MVKLISKDNLIWNDYGLKKKFETNLQSYYIWSTFYKNRIKCRKDYVDTSIKLIHKIMIINQQNINFSNNFLSLSLLKH